MSEKVLILYSGGADSRLMLEMAINQNMTIHCLLIDYGQLHKEELTFAVKQLNRLIDQGHPITYSRVNVDGLDLNSALTGDGKQGRFGDPDDISIWHVPGRNTMFAGIALSVAENIGCSVVWLGADYSDRLNNFVDCTQEFVVTMNKLYSVATTYPIRFEAPLMGMSKELILTLLKSNGVTEDDLFSGYGEIQEDVCKHKGEKCGCCGI